MRAWVRGFSTATAVIWLAACQTGPSGQASATVQSVVPPAPPPAAALPPTSDATLPDARNFPAFLANLRRDALAQGISPQTFDQTLAHAHLLPKVIELDRRQPEFTLTFQQYLANAVNDGKVRRGQARMAEQRALLRDVSAHYGVPARFIVALWGMETDYGHFSGGFSIIDALTTLAYDGRRSAFFRKELINALTMVDRHHVEPEAMRGSWAGAMGQPQFMPSSYLKYAVSWDGKGHPDIWTQPGDVFASAANYLAQSGWKGDEGWGHAVRLPPDFDSALVRLDVIKSVAEWTRLGVRGADGAPLVDSPDLRASLVYAVAGKGSETAIGPAYLVTDNFRVIMKWNHSVYYALAAGHLADRLGNL